MSSLEVMEQPNSSGENNIQPVKLHEEGGVTVKFKGRTWLFSLNKALRLQFKDSSQHTDSSVTGLKVAEVSL